MEAKTMFLDVLTLSMFFGAIPIALGILTAYSIIATVLGAFLWTGKTIPDDVGITITISGLAIGTVLILLWLYVRFVLS
jgi:hypothetical protein